MAIPLRFMCAVITKRAIAFHYPGGMPAFRARYCPIPYEDQWLVAFCAMSGGDLTEITTELTQHGLGVGRQVAIADMWAGPFEHARGIKFEAKTSWDGSVQWVAEVADEEYTPPKREKVYRRKPYPGETIFGGGGGVLIPMRFDSDVKRGKVIPANRRAQRRPPDSGETPDKAPGQPVEGTDRMLPAMDGLEDAIQSLVIKSMERRGIKPSEPSESTSAKPKGKS
jgi:hypothetical protein